MSFAGSVLLLAIGAVFGVLGTIVTQALNNRLQVSNAHKQRLQAKRDEYAARFRPLLTDIIATLDKVQRRAVFMNGDFAKDLTTYNDAFESYSARLKAEPDCEPLMMHLIAVHNAAKQYGFTENHHWTLLTSLEPQAALKTIDALNKAHQDLNDAVSEMSKALHDHMKLLDTPVS